MRHNNFKLRPDIPSISKQVENVRVCASCCWVWEYYDLGVSCPRCQYGSYSLKSISDSHEDTQRYVSLTMWKEITHLPEEIADWIIDVHRKSKAVESL